MIPHVEMTKTGGVATIRFNRPEKRNAISQATWPRLQALVEAADADPDVAVIKITGAGGHFISGADLDEYEHIHGSRDCTVDYLSMTSVVIESVAATAKPTVAVIEGACMGGGCLIALACDLRFAADTARFSLPPSKLGLMFPLAETRRVVDAVGAATAKDLLFSARVVGAEEAERIGLVNAVYPAAELDARADARIGAILANSQWSVRKVKQVVARILGGDRQDTEETRGWLRDALASPDFVEGQTAFKEKRAPRFGLS